MRRLLRSKIYLLVMLVFATVAAGTAGYMLIDGYGFLDALYMTIITLSTTGYGEVRPLSPAGRIFTIVLILMALSILAYSLASLSSFLLDGEFLVLLRKRRAYKQAGKMENHVIICGYGRNGHKAAEMLAVHNIPFVVIENGHAAAAELREHNITVLEESALDDDTLKAAGIMTAKALLTTLPDDTDNLYVVLSARAMNKNLAIISRASNVNVEKKLKIAGATDVVKPDAIGGSRMAQLVINPNMQEFIELVSYDTENMFKEIDLAAYEKLWGKNLKDIRKHTELDISVVGLKNEEGRYIINPSSNVVLTKGHQLVIMATADQMNAFKQHFA